MSGTPCNCAPANGISLLSLGDTPSVVTGTPITNGPNANLIANSLGVSPLYRQQDSARWQSAAHVYQSSRAVSPVPGFTPSTMSMTGDPIERENTCLNPHQLSQTLIAQTGVSSPISLEDIAIVNRKRHDDDGHTKLTHAEGGSLELEAIAAVHELATVVQTISVSEILPRTPDLIFVNVKTVENHPYTLELTMKGWRIASPHTDSMNGDYTQLETHTTYFKNAREVLQVISPYHNQCFHDNVAEKLNRFVDDQRNDSTK